MIHHGPHRSPPPSPILLRKYRNRRYYDTTRSLHVSLEDIYQLILDGQDVQVTDVDSGEDITAKVLAQIILEHDPGKLGAFPAELLHRVIRANEPLIRDFIDRYFNQFLRAYMESQRDFDRYLRQAMGLEFPVSGAGDWFRTMMWPLGRTGAPGWPVRRRRPLRCRRVRPPATPTPPPSWRGCGAWSRSCGPRRRSRRGPCAHQDQEEGMIVQLHNCSRVAGGAVAYSSGICGTKPRTRPLVLYCASALET